MAGGRRHASLDNPGLFVKPHIRYEFRYFAVGGGVCPRDEQAVTAADDRFGDEGHMFGGLTLTKHDLGKTLPVGAVVVDAREPEVLEGRVTRPGEIPGPAFRATLEAADGVVVVAGMEGALPSAVAGLVSTPVIAVPTSVGYGASFGGLAALLGMLSGCVPGVVVVNIDNGVGAALGAMRMFPA